MHIIKLLCKKTKDELHDAHHYIKDAILYKESYPELAETFYTISKQECEHSDMIHTQAVKMIKSYGKEAPREMQAIWDYLHEELIDEKAEIKRLQSIYRE